MEVGDQDVDAEDRDVVAWPGGEEDTKLITEAYVRVHYGELPENKEELTEIEAAWKRLESKPPAETERDSEGLSIQRSD